MPLTPTSVRAALLEQRERTRRCSNAEIVRIIEESELKIVSLDSKISSLIELRDQRACVLALKYIASPIHSLPVELLAEMFEHAIEDEKHIEDVYRISHVCSDWRQVAHSTPCLWTRPLEVALWIDKDAAVRAWLAWSVPLSLDICLTQTRTNNPDIPEEVLRVAARWQSSPNANSTASKSWTWDTYASKVDTDPTVTSFTTVPRLRNLRITIDGALQIAVLWTQLTNLTLDCVSLDITFEVLSQCADLASASIDFLVCDGQPPEVRRDNPIEVRQLQILHLQFDVELAPFLDYLFTPALQELELWLIAASTERHLPGIRPAVSASSNLMAAICRAPSLTHLILFSCEHCFRDDLIRALCYNDGVAPLAPCLHNLDVHNPTVMFTEDLLAAMIASRWWSDTELAGYTTAVARWTREIAIRSVPPLHRFGRGFDDAMKHIPPHVLIHSDARGS
ncbi:hypothetical protein C8R45DRAFT_1223786 [Mycena sanguinolenta]|nr:hypothetical protein C8R45DRAFT_1223786 [Mycena sanguinolenta]